VGVEILNQADYVQSHGITSTSCGTHPLDDGVREPLERATQRGVEQFHPAGEVIDNPPFGDPHPLSNTCQCCGGHAVLRNGLARRCAFSALSDMCADVLALSPCSASVSISA